MKLHARADIGLVSRYIVGADAVERHALYWHFRRVCCKAQRPLQTVHGLFTGGDRAFSQGGVRRTFLLKRVREPSGFRRPS